MNEVERLQQWLDERGYTIMSLAQAVGMSYDGVYQVVHARGEKRGVVSPGFQVRFIHAFGLDEAKRIFDTPDVWLPNPPVRGATRTPESEPADVTA
jgi:hypothetical protein